ANHSCRIARRRTRQRRPPFATGRKSQARADNLVAIRQVWSRMEPFGSYRTSLHRQGGLARKYLFATNSNVFRGDASLFVIGRCAGSPALQVQITRLSCVV